MSCDASYWFSAALYDDDSGTTPIFLFKSKNCGLVAQFTSVHLHILNKKDRNRIINIYQSGQRRIKFCKLPLADEDFLVKDGAIWTEERSFDGLSIRNVCAHVENLAAGLDVGVISCWHYKSIAINYWLELNSPKLHCRDILSLYNLTNNYRYAAQCI